MNWETLLTRMGIAKDSAKFLINRFLGWHTNRKIVVIESDDWGSIRMPSKAVYDKLLSQGIPVDSSPYCKYDALESEEDLTLLFEVLESVKDSKGNHAKLTANCIMANPDFDQIRDSGFTKYFYEPVTKTFENYLNHKNSFNLWLKGMRKGIFIPQFHGREHVNVPLWIDALQKSDKQVRIGFENKFFGLDWQGITPSKFGYMAPFDTFSFNAVEYHRGFIEEGLELFESYFGHKSKSFIAPCYIWNSTHEILAKEKGVELFQGIPFQFIPANTNSYKKQFHYIGQKNNGLYYTTRNCFFEPSILGQKESVERCLERIDKAFRSKKPAIIGSHRLNYIGSIESSNREENLILLQELLNEIISRWPEVEFLSTPELLNEF